LVTGDRDLLDIREKMHFEIITADSFMLKLDEF